MLFLNKNIYFFSFLDLEQVVNNKNLEVDKLQEDLIN
jgi:hypothetical protein